MSLFFGLDDLDERSGGWDGRSFSERFESASESDEEGSCSIGASIVKS